MARGTHSGTKRSVTKQSQQLPPSWSWLAQSIQRRFSKRPTGPQGFEGFVAELFEALLGERFILASSGRQPAGDAASSSGGTVLQAKRYGSTKLDGKSIQGDIVSAVRQTNPEIYVLVSTVSPDSQTYQDLLTTCSEEESCFN